MAKYAFSCSDCVFQTFQGPQQVGCKANFPKEYHTIKMSKHGDWFLDDEVCHFKRHAAWLNKENPIENEIARAYWENSLANSALALRFTNAEDVVTKIQNLKFKFRKIIIYTTNWENFPSNIEKLNELGFYKSKNHDFTHVTPPVFTTLNSLCEECRYLLISEDHELTTYNLELIMGWLTHQVVDRNFKFSTIADSKKNNVIIDNFPFIDDPPDYKLETIDNASIQNLIWKEETKEFMGEY